MCSYYAYAQNSVLLNIVEILFVVLFGEPASTYVEHGTHNQETFWKYF